MPECLSVIISRSKATVYFLKILPVYLCGLNWLHDEAGCVLQNIIVMGSQPHSYITIKYAFLEHFNVIAPLQEFPRSLTTILGRIYGTLT